MSPLRIDHKTTKEQNPTKLCAYFIEHFLCDVCLFILFFFRICRDDVCQQDALTTVDRFMMSRDFFDHYAPSDLSATARCAEFTILDLWPAGGFELFNHIMSDWLWWVSVKEASLMSVSNGVTSLLQWLMTVLYWGTLFKVCYTDCVSYFTM